MAKIVGRFPRPLQGVVSHPIDEGPELATPESEIEDIINVQLMSLVHLDRLRDLHDSARERVCHMWLEEANMEDWMNMC